MSTELKVVLLGGPGVGKTSIILRYVAGDFKRDPSSTIGAAFMKKTVKLDGKTVEFNIWDTAGHERFHTLARSYYRSAAAAVLVYDVTKYESFLEVKRWHDELERETGEKLHLVLAANKEDLVAEETVNPGEAEQYAQSIQAVYQRVSAKTAHGIDSLFTQLAERVLSGKRPSAVRTSINLDKQPPHKKKKCC